MFYCKGKRNNIYFNYIQTKLKSKDQKDSIGFVCELTFLLVKWRTKKMAATLTR